MPPTRMTQMMGNTSNDINVSGHESGMLVMRSDQGESRCKKTTKDSDCHCTFVNDELALGAAELAQVQHGDVVVHTHGVLECARVLDGRPAAQ